jgi:hypothetical protein
VSIPENISMKILCLFLIISLPQAFAKSELTLYFLPSSTKVDWSSPKKLLKSILLNRWQDSDKFLGYTYVDLKCQNFSSLTAVHDNSSIFKELTLNQRGFGFLAHTYEGVFENSEHLKSELENYLNEGKVNFIKFKINESNCERLKKYQEEFIKYKISKNYGLIHRPLYGEGVNALSYGISYLEASDILDQEFRDRWTSYVNIPEYLQGQPLKDKNIGMLDILFSKDSWAKENQKHFKFIFWDIDKIYEWVKLKTQTNQSGIFKVAEEKKSKGIEIDKTNWPTPKKLIWKAQGHGAKAP